MPRSSMTGLAMWLRKPPITTDLRSWSIQDLGLVMSRWPLVCNFIDSPYSSPGGLHRWSLCPFRRSYWPAADRQGTDLIAAQLQKQIYSNINLDCNENTRACILTERHQPRNSQTHKYTVSARPDLLAAFKLFLPPQGTVVLFSSDSRLEKHRPKTLQSCWCHTGGCSKVLRGRFPPEQPPRQALLMLCKRFGKDIELVLVDVSIKECVTKIDDDDVLCVYELWRQLQQLGDSRPCRLEDVQVEVENLLQGLAAACRESTPCMECNTQDSIMQSGS